MYVEGGGEDVDVALEVGPGERLLLAEPLGDDEAHEGEALLELALLRLAELGKTVPVVRHRDEQRVVQDALPAPGPGSGEQGGG